MKNVLFGLLATKSRINLFSKPESLPPAMPPPAVATLSLLLLLFPLQSSAQSTRSGGGGDDFSYSSNFTPGMAILVAILISSTFLAGILYIYVRKCTDAGGGTVWATQRVPRAAAARGLEASAIAAFPTMVYSEVKGSRIGKGALECAICLNEFEEDETLRLIPRCDHVFHPDCIDVWLGSHTTCPVCRADLVPQPGDSVAKQPEFARPDSDLEAQIEAELPAEANADSRGRRFLWSRSMERPVQIRAGESSERFTLRLSSEMRSKIMERSKSMILATERSSPRGFRGGGVKLEQSSNFMRFSSFLLRMPSIKSAKVAADSGGDGEGTSSTQV